MLTDRAGVPWLLMFITILGVATPSSDRESGVPGVAKAQKSTAGAAAPSGQESEVRRSAGALTCSVVGNQLTCSGANKPSCEIAACTARMFEPLRANGIVGTVADEDCRRPAQQLERWLDPLSRAHNPRFMVATLPDPAESGQLHEYDRALDAAIRAIEDSGYLRANFYLPWSREKRTRGPDCAKQVPGLVVFRGQKDPTDLLGLLVVGETPTSGPSRDQLAIALELAAAFPLHENIIAGVRPEISILGPYFSGSALPLADALASWNATANNIHALEPGHRSSDARFVLRSGTATAMNVKEMKRLLPGLDIRALTLNLETMLSGYFDFLETCCGVDRTRNTLDGVALLTEEGTGYGAASSPIQPKLTLHFPRNIAELRARWEARRDAAEQKPSNALTKLSTPLFLDADYDEAASSDQPLSLSDETSVSDDLVLTDELKTLARHDVRHIGIVATSVADVIFLARQIRLHMPDTRLFIVQTDELLTHPQHESSLLGATVVSSYPLANFGADWVYPFFPNGNTVNRISRSSAQGVYNAAVTLLLKNQDVAPKLIAYGDPFKLPDGRDIRPPVWLSAIGHGGMWPLSARGPVSVEDNYAQPTSAPRTKDDCTDTPNVLPSKSWRSAIAIIVCLGALLITGIWAAGRRVLPRTLHIFEAFSSNAYVTSKDGEKEVPRSTSSQWLLLAAVAVLLGALAHVATIAAIPWWGAWLTDSARFCVRYSVTLRDFYLPMILPALLIVALAVAYHACLRRRVIASPQQVAGEQEAARSAAVPQVEPQSLARVSGDSVRVSSVSTNRRSLPPSSATHVTSALPPAPTANDATAPHEPVHDRKPGTHWPLKAVLVLIATATISCLLVPLSARDAFSSGFLPTPTSLAFYYARTTALTSRLSVLGPLLLQAVTWFLTCSVYLERDRILAADTCDNMTKLAKALVGPRGTDRVAALMQACKNPFQRRALFWAFPVLVIFPLCVFRLQKPSTLANPAGIWALVAITLIGLTIAAVNVVRFAVIWAEFRAFLRQIAFDPPLPLSTLKPESDQLLGTSWIGGMISRQQIVVLRNAVFRLQGTKPQAAPVASDSGHWDAALACELTSVFDTLGDSSLHELVTPHDGPTRRKAIEELFASGISIVVGFVTQQLRNLLGLMLVNALLTALTVSWYPVEPRRLLSTINWFMVAATLLITLTVFIKTEQDTVLRHLRGRSNGWLLGDRNFLSQVFLWVVLPFLAFLASQYPAGASALLQTLSSFSIPTGS